jgi:hypothetical protein
MRVIVENNYCVLGAEKVDLIIAQSCFAARSQHSPLQFAFSDVAGGRTVAAIARLLPETYSKRSILLLWAHVRISPNSHVNFLLIAHHLN